MSTRLNARDRLARLLSVIPWVAERADGARLDDIVARFEYPRDQLVHDLQDVVFFVGVHPFTPDSLIEVEVGDGRVRIRYADWFSRPLRLSPEESARLLTAGRSVLSLTEPATSVDPNDEAASPLLRALTKLGIALGEDAHNAVDVRLGYAASDTLAALRDAIAAGRQVELEYYAYGRDELTERRVDPGRVFSDQGKWYLGGWCHRANAERVFRVDRIRSAVVTDTPAAGTDTSNVSAFNPTGDDPRVTLRLRPGAHWVVEQFPIESAKPDGADLVVRMVVSAEAWLERLLLRIGDAGEVLEAEPPLERDLRRAAARRVLARYDPDLSKLSGNDR